MRNSKAAGKRLHGSRLGAIGFMLPAFAVYTCVIVVPSFYSLYLSLFKWNGVAPEKKFVGIQNYIDLFTKDSVFKIAIRNNILWTLLTMVFTVGLALLLALLLNQKFRGRTFFRGVFYFPYILSGIVVAMVWSWMYQPQFGLFNSLFNAIGLSDLAKPWLSDPNTAFIAVYIASLWQGFGGPMVIFLAGLQSVPAELYEAAKVDGAGRLSTFFRVTIPMMRETFVIVFATQIISSMKVYDIIQGMTAGGPSQSTQTMSTWMIQQTFSFANVGVGTAISWVMVIILMLIIPYVLFMAKE